MNITVCELAAAVTAVVLWLTILDLAALVNVSCWFCITWLIRKGREDK